VRRGSALGSYIARVNIILVGNEPGITCRLLNRGLSGVWRC